MSFPVFLDTCVLYPATLTDPLLCIAEQGAYRPHSRRIAAMTAAFESAMVTGCEDLIPAMTCDAKDAHVLAAAVVSDCQVIVTFKLKDFPDEALVVHDLVAVHHDLVAVHPDDFLLDQLDLYPAAVLAALAAQVRDSARPRLTLLTLLASLERPDCRSWTPRSDARATRGCGTEPARGFDSHVATAGGASSRSHRSAVRCGPPRVRSSNLRSCPQTHV